MITTATITNFCTSVYDLLYTTRFCLQVATDRLLW